MLNMGMSHMDDCVDMCILFNLYNNQKLLYWLRYIRFDSKTPVRMPWTLHTPTFNGIYVFTLPLTLFRLSLRKGSALIGIPCYNSVKRFTIILCISVTKQIYFDFLYGRLHRDWVSHSVKLNWRANNYIKCGWQLIATVSVAPLAYMHEEWINLRSITWNLIICWTWLCGRHFYIM